MNSFGRLLRVQILGESHGELVGAVLDGCPAGLPLSEGDLASDLSRRRAGRRGTTARAEPDEPRLRSGVFEGRTTGAPVLIEIPNRDARPGDYEALRHRPRPGHADLVARQKSGGFNDFRGGGRHSGRMTAALVAAGAVARKLLPEVRIRARVLEVGGRADVAAAIDEALASGETLGGLLECRAEGIAPGLGEPFFDTLEGLLAHAAFAIPGVRGVEFGSGFSAAAMLGSQGRDELLDARGRTRRNLAGGVLGGISDGNPLVWRVAVKPPVSGGGPLRTLDLRTGKRVTLEVGGRHDACIAVRVPVVLEAVTALVLADLMLLEQRIPRVWPGRRKR